MKTIQCFLREESGASLAEYALLLGVIAVALIAVLANFKNAIANIFDRTTTVLNSAGS